MQSNQESLSDVPSDLERRRQDPEPSAVFRVHARPNGEVDLVLEQGYRVRLEADDIHIDWERADAQATLTFQIHNPSTEDAVEFDGFSIGFTGEGMVTGPRQPLAVAGQWQLVPITHLVLEISQNRTWMRNEALIYSLLLNFRRVNDPGTAWMHDPKIYNDGPTVPPPKKE